MYMKKNFYFLLMAALVCGLSLSVTSCKSDDDDNNSEGQQGQEEQAVDEPAVIFWDVVSQLAGAGAITEDYQNKQFEPVIGDPSEDNELYRVVGTNDLATAASRFNQLIGEEKVDTNTTEYTWHNDAVGTLTYRQSTDGKSWATVDVSIQQMQKLEKIIYREPSQGDANAAFDGTAYYRFGDIISKPKIDAEDDEDVELWICVRPCFGPEKKDHSHWVCIFDLPSKNIWKYKASNGIQYALPTGLGKNEEHAQNFAEMLFAIYFPEDWETNVKNNKKLPMFGDFDKGKLKYHSKYFWQRVQAQWRNNNVHEDIFGHKYNGVAAMKGMLLSEDGLNLLTKGKSWNTLSSNSPTLYRQRFTNGTGKESNMHKGGEIKSISKEVIKSKIKLNCEQYLDGWECSPFFGTSTRHYIIRYASGAELASNGKEDPKKPLKGVTDVYRYNDVYGISVSAKPETFDSQGNPVK